MTHRLQLLKQIRSIVADPALSSSPGDWPTYRKLIDAYLDELIRLEDADFYRGYLQRGKELVDEGNRLVTRRQRDAYSPSPSPIDCAESLMTDAVHDRIVTINDDLVRISRDMLRNESPGDNEYLKRVFHWESLLHSRRLAPIHLSSLEAVASPPSANSLQQYLQRKYPHWIGLQVTRFRLLSGGLSKTTILFESDDEINGIQEMVIRAEKPFRLLDIAGCEVEREFYAVRFAYEAGLCVPEPLWLETDASILGGPFMVSRMARGTTIGTSQGASTIVSDATMHNMLETLIQIHSVSIDSSNINLRRSHLNEWMQARTITECNAYFATTYLPALIEKSRIRRTPQLERALRWLQTNIPQVDDSPVLVHLDYGFNNILFENETPTAVLDWEISRLGDPSDDLFWLQKGTKKYGMPELLSMYQQFTGRAVTPFRIAYSEISQWIMSYIAGLNSLQVIDQHDTAPYQMGIMAFQYMPAFCSNVDAMIQSASKLRD